MISSVVGTTSCRNTASGCSLIRGRYGLDEHVFRIGLLPNDVDDAMCAHFESILVQPIDIPREQLEALARRNRPVSTSKLSLAGERGYSALTVSDTARYLASRSERLSLAANPNRFAARLLLPSLDPDW